MKPSAISYQPSAISLGLVAGLLAMFDKQIMNQKLFHDDSEKRYGKAHET
jgi:hypothetical protein